MPEKNRMKKRLLIDDIEGKLSALNSAINIEKLETPCIERITKHLITSEIISF